MVPATVSADVPTSMNLVYKLAHTRIQRFVSKVILSLIKLTVTITHHSLLSTRSTTEPHGTPFLNPFLLGANPFFLEGSAWSGS